MDPAQLRRTPSQKPNEHIKYIVPLPGATADAAQRYLETIAAQVKPLMKAHGMRVNSFEEYEWNAVFAGRNWNAGENIELVLRARSGEWLSKATTLRVMCHELAHCHHMNHGPAFRKLNAQLVAEVVALQRQGYFGDGFWSAGRQVADGTLVDGLSAADDIGAAHLCDESTFRRRKGYSNNRGALNAQRRARKQRQQTTERSAKPAKSFKGRGRVLMTKRDADKAARERARAERLEAQPRIPFARARETVHSDNNIDEDDDGDDRGDIYKNNDDERGFDEKNDDERDESSAESSVLSGSDDDEHELPLPQIRRAFDSADKDGGCLVRLQGQTFTQLPPPQKPQKPKEDKGKRKREPPPLLTSALPSNLATSNASAPPPPLSLPCVPLKRTHVDIDALIARLHEIDPATTSDFEDIIDGIETRIPPTQERPHRPITVRRLHEPARAAVDTKERTRAPRKPQAEVIDLTSD